MKTVVIILSVIDALLLGSTLLCGFWIRANQGSNPDPSSVGFHAFLAVATSVLVVITLVLMIVFLRKV